MYQEWGIGDLRSWIESDKGLISFERDAESGFITMNGLSPGEIDRGLEDLMSKQQNSCPLMSFVVEIQI